jgi:SNF2 family DNA or RNA helicase
MARIPPLFGHQVQSTAFMAQHDRALDASDPGTGKTRVQIEDFAARRTRGCGRALVIAPKSLLHSAWEADIEQFAPQLRVSVATAKNREEAFKEDADVYVTNTDATRWLAKQPASFFRRFDTLIVDEITSFKHPTSQRSKALSKIRAYFKYRRGLTGTPNANTILDMWHQVFLLDDGQRLGKSYFAFRSQVCSPRQVGPQPNMVKWEDKPGAEIAVGDLIKDITIRHKFEECVDIPPNHQYTVPFRMVPRHEQHYKKMQDDAILQLRGGTVTAVNAAVMVAKLLQVASGAVYDGSGKYHVLDAGRYELVTELVAARRHSLVFFLWEHQRDELIRQFQAEGITYAVVDGSVSDKKRDEAVRNFQAGFYRVLLAHPQSAAHGLTFTRATTAIWCSPTYNLEHYLQGNRRIYRIGQAHRTETISVVAPNTIEEKVASRLAEKGERQMDLLSILQEVA